MNQYKDTTPPAKPQHGATSGQHERKKRLKDKIEVAIGMTFLFCFLLSVTTCQPVQSYDEKSPVTNSHSNAQAYRQALHKHDVSMDKIATSSQPKGNDRLATVSQAFNQNLVTAIKNNLLLGAGVGQNKDLSKLVSGKPCRYPLAFFVPEFWLASQASQDKDTTHLTHFTGLNRLIYSRPQLEDVTNYGGVTLQNKPIGEYAGRFLTRPRVNPATLLRNFRSNVVLTQNLLGGHYHA